MYAEEAFAFYNNTQFINNYSDEDDAIEMIKAGGFCSKFNRFIKSDPSYIKMQPFELSNVISFDFLHYQILWWGGDIYATITLRKLRNL